MYCFAWALAMAAAIRGSGEAKRMSTRRLLRMGRTVRRAEE